MEKNIESLIERNEKWLALFIKTLKKYSNINIRQALWEEVCATVIHNWTYLIGV